MNQPVAIYAQPRPGNPTTATVITKAEIDKISATEQSQRTRDENAKVVDIGDGWSMELGIIHRASTRNPPPAPAAGAGNAQAAAQTTPCGERMANPPADAIPGAITHDNQTEGYYIVSGGGTAFIDGHVVNGRHSTANPDGGPNGPGCGGLAVGSRKVELKVGDVLIVGTLMLPALRDDTRDDARPGRQCRAVHRSPPSYPEELPRLLVA